MSRFADMPDEWRRSQEIEDHCAAGITPTEVHWLWRGRVPFGKLSMFDGDPDLGKSVVTVDITARISTGRSFPDGAPVEAGNVLMVNVEDAAGDTIVPRLMAHGADLERVFLFSNVPDGRGGKRLLELPGDVSILENLVLKREARLLIIDPVLTVLSGDANKDQDARKALSPLAEMADRTGVAVVAVRHLNKSVGLKAIQRGGGNMGLIGVARAGAFFAKDPEDNRRRIMAPHKSNLAEKPTSLVYRIVTSEVHNTARVEWMGTSEYDADGLAADATTPHEKSQLDEAKDFLREELGDGPVWAKQVYKDARDAGVSDRTLQRAKDALKVRSEKLGTQGWSWSLPDKEHRHGEGRQEGSHVQDLGDLGNVGYLGDLPINKANGPSNENHKAEHRQGSQDSQGSQGYPGGVVDNISEELAALFGDPPEWLVGQLRRCREDEAIIRPTCSTVSYEVYGTATRWREVEPLVRARLNGVTGEEGRI